MAKSKSPQADNRKQLSKALALVLRELTNTYSTAGGYQGSTAAQISEVVERLAKQGKIQNDDTFKSAMKTYAVYAEDVIENRERSDYPRELGKVLDERYAIGGTSDAETAEESEAVKTIRTAKPVRGIKGYDSPMSPEVQAIVGDALSSKTGRRFARTRIRAMTNLEPARRRGPSAVNRRLESISAGARSAKKRFEESEQIKPYKGKGFTPRGGKILPGKGGIAKSPTTGLPLINKKGKPAYLFDDGKPLYFKPETLQNIYDERAVFPEGARPPVEKTRLFRLNEAAKKGSVKAAIELRREMNRMFGTKKRYETSRTKNPKTGKYSARPKTPAQKERSRARGEAKALGRGALELAKRKTAERRVELRGDEPMLARIMRRKERAIRTTPEGEITEGPLTRSAFARLKDYAAERLEQLRPRGDSMRALETKRKMQFPSRIEEPPTRPSLRGRVRSTTGSREADVALRELRESGRDVRRAQMARGLLEQVMRGNRPGVVKRSVELPEVPAMTRAARSARNPVLEERVGGEVQAMESDRARRALMQDLARAARAKDGRRFLSLIQNAPPAMRLQAIRKFRSMMRGGRR